MKADQDNETTWSKKDLMLHKLDMLRKLGELQADGVTLSQVYSLDSDYDTMKYEYILLKKYGACP